jgi:glycosyltransferase involved in cell wall biosynthesis
MNATPALGGGAGRRREGLRIAMALYADVTFDSRVLREAQTLAGVGHEVTIHCLTGSPPTGAPFRVIARTPKGTPVLPDGSSPFLRTSNVSFAGRLAERLRWMLGYWNAVRTWGRLTVAAAGAVDVWHVHDLTGLLAIGPLVRGSCRLVYDSHDIFVETGTSARLPRVLRRVLTAYEGHLARRAVALITVNEGYARVLRRRLRPRQTLIVRNCPPRWTPADTSSSRLRDIAMVPAPQLLILYHGAFSQNRGIEELAEALLLPGLESVHLALLGLGSTRPKLEDLTRENRFQGRLHVLDPVPPSELLELVAGADLDVIPLQRSELNHWLCTPNKLWESLAAGVPVLVSDFPEMRRIVLGNPGGPLGAACDPSRPESIAAGIRSILELPKDELTSLRARCHQAAHERWNWESESSVLIDLYEEIRERRDRTSTRADRVARFGS